MIDIRRSLLADKMKNREVLEVKREDEPYIKPGAIRSWENEARRS